MKYNFLGTSDLKVSAIGFGAMSLELDKPNEVDTLLRCALDNGINYIDTADLYDGGMNERILGQVIHPFRHDLIIATKVGNRLRADKEGWDWDVSADYLREAVELSLRRLRTDYIDLYQIHGGTNQDNFDEVVSTLESFVDEGKIRAYGISSIRPNVFVNYSQHSRIVSNMMQYSILDRRPEEYFPVLDENHVSIIARGVLAQGLLVNKKPKQYLDYSEQEVSLLQNQIQHLCKMTGIDPIAIALAYVFRNKEVAAAVIGIRTKEQLKDILEGYKQAIDIPIHLSDIALRKNNYVDHLI